MDFASLIATNKANRKSVGDGKVKSRPWNYLEMISPHELHISHVDDSVSGKHNLFVGTGFEKTHNGSYVRVKMHVIRSRVKLKTTHG